LTSGLTALTNELNDLPCFFRGAPSGRSSRTGGANGGLDASSDLFPVNVRHHSHITRFVTHAHELSLTIKPLSLSDAFRRLRLNKSPRSTRKPHPLSKSTCVFTTNPQSFGSEHGSTNAFSRSAASNRVSSLKTSDPNTLKKSSTTASCQYCLSVSTSGATSSGVAPLRSF